MSVSFLIDSEEDEKYHLTKYVTVIPIGYQFRHDQVRYPSNHVLNGKSKSVPNGLNHIPPEITVSTSSDSEHEIDNEISTNRFSVMSGDSFNRHALTALKELDAAMAAEVSDLETNASGVEAGKKFDMVDAKSSISRKTSSPSPGGAPPPPGLYNGYTSIW